MTKAQFIENCCIALEVDPGSLDEQSTPDDVSTWDSMGWISLMAMIDEELGVTLDAEELTNVKNLGQLIEILEKQDLLD